MKKSTGIAAVIYAVYLAIVVVAGRSLDFGTARVVIFCIVLGALGAIALVVGLIYTRAATGLGRGMAVSATDESDLDTLVRSAATRMKSADRATRPLASTPLVYVLGDENSAKTQTVLQSGLNAELLAGAVYGDNTVAPTKLANIWYAPSAVIVEAGGALLRHPGLWQRLVQLTRSSTLDASLKSGEQPSGRAVVLCVSVERLTATNSKESVCALGQMLNERLRLLSQTLGSSFPVYVLFTKLDALPSFAEFAANLTDEEAVQPVGAFLPRFNLNAANSSETIRATAAERVDELCFSLSKFRMMVLGRGGGPAELAKAYEFPREFRKLRNSIVDLLVELGRTSQLGGNPFLRGFYFTGTRTRLTDDGIGDPGAAKTAAKAAPDATTIFALSAGQLAQTPLPMPRRKDRHVKQWAFLPLLLPRIILTDSSALEISSATHRPFSGKRLLMAAAAFCVLLYLVAVSISYANNTHLENRLNEAAEASVSPSTPPDFIASAEELQKLDALRLVFLQIARYRKNGPPAAYRWGLYPGDALYDKACTAYANRFRTLMLAPTQASILSRLGGLPTTWLPTDDYESVYRPLRAYLITTSYPQYSTADFLPDALQKAWVSDRILPPDVSDLALAQFQTYATSLNEPGSCMATLAASPADPQVPSEVSHARAYLNQAQPVEQIYVRMKSAANQRYAAILFNEKFPGTFRYLVDSYRVEGAFTKDGYPFMREAILHPESYASGDEWVVSHQNQNGMDPSALATQLRARYLSDFLNVWRTYLKSARVVGGGDWMDVQEKLTQLTGPASPLFALFETISQNTAVDDPDFAAPFQAPRAVVPPAATGLPSAYVAALAGLKASVDDLVASGSRNTEKLRRVDQAIDNAERAVGSLRAGFPQGDTTAAATAASNDLLTQPVRSVQALTRDVVK